MAVNTAWSNWDITKACQQFQSHSVNIQTQQKKKFNIAIKGLQTVSDDFYLRALDSGYTIPNRTPKQAKTFDDYYLDFVRWVHMEPCPASIAENGLSNRITLKIIILKITRFLIWKFYQGPVNVVQFALDAVKLALDCCCLCCDEKRVDDMVWSWKEALAYHLQSANLTSQHQKTILDFNQIELEKLTAEVFCILLTEKPTESRTKISQMFADLEVMGHTSMMKELLAKLPWREKMVESAAVYTIPLSLLPKLRWICAEVAVLSCLSNAKDEECLEILRDIASWTRNTSSVDPASLKSIVVKALPKAHKIESPPEKLIWFVTLMEICHRNGLLHRLFVDAVRLSISLDSSEALSSVKQILDSIGGPATYIELLRFKLLFASLDKNESKAIQSCILLENKYKKETTLSSDWVEGCEILKKCIECCLEHGMDKLLDHCLSALNQELDTHPSTIAFVSDIANFVAKVVFHLSKENLIFEKKCVDLFIKTLVSATELLTKPSSDGLTDATNLALQLGDTALRLAEYTSSHTTPFNQHLLFQNSYILLNLDPNRDEDLGKKISNAILMAMAAGIASEGRSDYNVILKLLPGYVSNYSGPDSIQLRFYSFYSLCELGDLTKVNLTIQRYRSEENALLFDGFASLASSNNRQYLRSVLPDSVRTCLLPDEEHRPRNLNLQIELSKVAILCMKEVIRWQVKQPSEPDAMDSSDTGANRQSISSSWQKILLFAQENVFANEEVMEQCYRLFSECLGFIQANREHFDAAQIQIFLNESWKVVGTVTANKGKQVAERWNTFARLAESIFGARDG